MDIFVDTSVFSALMDADDLNHESTKAAWSEWLYQPARFVCSDYVLLESMR